MVQDLSVGVAVAAETPKMLALHLGLWDNRGGTGTSLLLAEKP
jgi:hypothetical protein